MAVDIKSLYKGQLGSSEGNLYGPASGKAALVKSIRLVNTGGSPVTVNLFVKRGSGSSYRVIPKDLSLAAGAAFIDNDEVALEYVDGSNIDYLRGVASAATTVDCVISGIEKTL